MTLLPDFKLETFFSRWEFNAKYHMCASDMESVSMVELLDMASENDKKKWHELKLGYTETFGSKELRIAISKTYDFLKEKNILTFSGAEEGIFVAMQCLLNKQDHAIVIIPNYQSVETLPSSICDVTGVALDPNDNWNLDIQKLKDTIKSNTRLISINFPNNPTGKVISENTLNTLISISRDKGIYIFSDEIYRLIERDKSKRLTQISDIYERGISLNGMSKSYGMPGLRIGWIASQDEILLKKMEHTKHYLSICNSAPSEILATIALHAKKEILLRNHKIVNKNLQILNNFFASNSDLFAWREPDGGCIGFPKYLGREGVEIFCERLIKEKGVLLLPSRIYQSDCGPSPQNHFRIGYGRADMEEGLQGIKHFIDRKNK